MSYYIQHTQTAVTAQQVTTIKLDVQINKHIIVRYTCMSVIVIRRKLKRLKQRLTAVNDSQSKFQNY